MFVVKRLSKFMQMCLYCAAQANLKIQIHRNDCCAFIRFNG